MDTNPICPGCQKPLPPDVPLGLCPECLIKAGFNTGTDSGGQSTEFVPPPVEQIAKLFPQLEVLEFIGKGGMGAVYKARQPSLDRLVALKILPPHVAGAPGFAERFNREARALARLTHPNIVAIHEFGEAGGLHYFVMEFVDGGNLRQVERAGHLAPEQALAIVPQICEALQFAHNEGVVHRDIKPENILLDKKGRVKITDFGIAKILGVPADKGLLTRAKDVVGTPNYMAPEQIEHPALVDHRADIFSLGVVFYEMLTGELPLGKFAPPSKKVQMDVRLDEVVLHALEKEPARRYQQASQVKTAVETITETPPQLAPAPLASSVGNPLSGPGKITAPAVALIVAALWKLLSAFKAMFFLTVSSGWLYKLTGLGNLLGAKERETILAEMGKLTGLGNLLGGWNSMAIFGLVLFKVIPGLLILFGGFQMLQRRSYAWAIAAGIISIVSCSLIGLPIGIWALVVLARDDVKAAFAPSAPAAPVAPKSERSVRGLAAFTRGMVLIPIALVSVVVLAGVFAASAMQDRAKEATAQNPPQAGIHQDAGGQFRKDFSRSFPFNADGRLSLDHVKGRIEIHGWSSNLVVINAAIHGKTRESVEAVKINIDSEPNRAVIHTDQPSSVTGFPWSWLWFKTDKRNDASVDYIIHVPRRARLAGIGTLNGRIAIDGVAGDIAASSINGEMQIKGAARNLKLSTINGRIVANMVSLGGGRSVSLELVNGVLELRVPEDADAKFSVSTVNGRITSEFPSLKAKKEFAVGSHLRGTLGNGSATVKAAAVNGSIKILKNQTAEQTSANTPDITADQISVEQKQEPAADSAAAEGLGQTVAELPPVAVATEPVSGARDGPTHSLRVIVDPRVELMSLIFRLAGNPEYNRARVTSYAEDAEKQFGKFRDHTVVELAQELRNTHSVSYDAVMSMAVHLTDAKRPELKLPLQPWPEGLDQRWTASDVGNFLAAARQFVNDSSFQEFIEQHRPLYQTTVTRMQTLIDKEAHLEWFDAYFGPRPHASFTVVLGLLNGGNCYGPHFRTADGREELYCVLGVWKTDNQGLPEFTRDGLGTVIHEFCHSYANPIIERHQAQLSAAGEALFAPVAAKMRSQAYGSGHTLLCESLVRVCVIRYLRQYEGEEAARRAIQTEKRNGFLWMPEMSDLLGDYEGHRGQYPTLEDFAPRLAAFFAQTAQLH